MRVASLSGHACWRRTATRLPAKEGRRLADFAVLYRTDAQWRSEMSTGQHPLQEEHALARLPWKALLQLKATAICRRSPRPPTD
jgi:hypothetical protein